MQLGIPATISLSLFDNFVSSRQPVLFCWHIYSAATDEGKAGVYGLQLSYGCDQLE
jgi:hypothetical protein